MVQLPAKKLTAREIPLLPEQFNLADGHAHRSWSASESRIIAGTEELMRAADREQQPEIEAAYTRRLLQLTRQTYDPVNIKYLLCTTASESLEIVANYLRLHGKSVALIQPCFDNLADIFRRHWLRMEPVDDGVLTSEQELDETLSRLRVDAICIVTPNNPTGRTISYECFTKLVTYCSRRGTVLIIDACFRVYTPLRDQFDQYAMLVASGIDFIVVEDTGKTWPTRELKVSVLAASNALHRALFDIYADFLLHVSPFAVSLLTRFVDLSVKDQSNHLKSIVAQNRALLYAAIDGTGLSPAELPHMSVAWLATGSATGRSVMVDLEQCSVFVLHGERFYWSDPELGSHFIRIALVRDSATFSQACDRIRSALRSN